MKKITQGKRGIVLKNGIVTRVLGTGWHVIFWNERCVVSSMTQPLTVGVELEILRANAALMEQVTTVEVLANEVCIVTVNGHLERVLQEGTYLFWKGFRDFAFAKADTTSIYIDENVPAVFYKTLRDLGLVIAVSVNSGENAVLMVDGKESGVLEAGEYWFWNNDTKVEVARTDMRKRMLEISGQEILTSDKVTVRVTLTAIFKVVNIVTALIENKAFETQLYIALQHALRELVGAFTMDELLENKATLGNSLREAVASTAADLGIELHSVGVKDVILTGEMRAMMNKVILAQKEAQASVITRREEAAQTRLMLNAAKLMDENETLFKLKEMEFIERIADRVGDITLSSNGNVVRQLKEIFTAAK